MNFVPVQPKELQLIGAVIGIANVNIAIDGMLRCVQADVHHIIGTVLPIPRARLPTGAAILVSVRIIEQRMKKVMLVIGRFVLRSEERRVGKEWVTTCRTRG